MDSSFAAVCACKRPGKGSGGVRCGAGWAAAQKSFGHSSLDAKIAHLQIRPILNGMMQLFGPVLSRRQDLPLPRPASSLHGGRPGRVVRPGRVFLSSSRRRGRFWTARETHSGTRLGGIVGGSVDSPRTGFVARVVPS